jgi:hypothetical protein
VLILVQHACAHVVECTGRRGRAATRPIYALASRGSADERKSVSPVPAVSPVRPHRRADSRWSAGPPDACRSELAAATVRLERALCRSSLTSNANYARRWPAQPYR